MKNKMIVLMLSVAFVCFNQATIAKAEEYVASEYVQNDNEDGIPDENKCGDDIIWSYDSNTLTLTLSGTGDMYDECEKPWKKYDVVYIEIEDGITSIGEYAFSGMNYLKKVSMPDSVSNINNSAFEECNSLEEINISESIKAIEDNCFKYCAALKNIDIPNGVTKIGKEAFWGCSSITVLNIPTTVESIGEGAFAKCEKLRETNIPEKVTEIEDYTYYECSALERMIIPNTVNEIGFAVFYGCKNLSYVQLPEGLDEISESLFYKCNSLREVNIPAGVKVIGMQAFEECQALEKIELPQMLEKIEASFYGCASITSLKIPASVKIVSNGAFAYCSGLKEITIEGKNTVIYDSAFSGVGIKDNGRYNPKLYLPEDWSGKTWVDNNTSWYGGYFNLKNSASTKYVSVDGINFPDKNFREYLKTLEPYIDGKIDVLEIYEIECPNSNISSLKGIDYFENLESIDCNNNNLTSLDLSKNKKLEQLYCNNNKLKALKLGNLTKLVGFACDNNQLTELDISKCPELVSISCANNMITKLNITSKRVGYLDCSNNQLEQLILTSSDMELATVFCANNQLACLDFGGRDIGSADLSTQYIKRNFISGVIDMSGYVGFNPSKVVDLKGATISGKQLIINDYGRDANKITYSYMCASGVAMDVEIENTNKIYKITYILDGGINSSANPASYKEGSAFTFANPTYKGYVFAGWYTDNAFKNRITKVTSTTKGHLILYAKWENQLAKPVISKIINTVNGTKLTWKKVTGAQKYAIMRYNASTKKWEKIATAKASAVTYTDKNVKSGKTYKYAIKCVGTDEAIDTSALSKTVSIKYIATPKITSIKNSSAGKVTLKWSKANGAKKYAVYRKVAGGKWKKVATISKTTYTDKNVKKGKTYTYAIQSLDSKGKVVSDSAKKNTKKIKIKK